MRRSLAYVLAAIVLCLIAVSPADAAGLSVHLAVSPNPMQRDQRDAVLLAVTTPGALCRASVRYLDGRELGLPSQKAIRQGLVVWVWHESTSGAGGVADVTCSLDGATASATAGFRVQR